MPHECLLARMTRLQFTLRSMFICVSFIAMGCGCMRASISLSETDFLGGNAKFWLYNAGAAFVGAGIGVLFRQHVRGAVYAAVCVYMVPVVLAILSGIFSN